MLAIWILLTPPFTDPLNPVSDTRKNLQELSKFLQDYKTNFKEYPANLSILRQFAYSKGELIPLFDAYGERIEYLRLTDSAYLLRSFGADGSQNTIQSPKDIGLIRWGLLPQGGAYYDSKPELIPHFYRAASLMGLDSPETSWHARVFTNKSEQRRHLVVKHKSATDLIMIAPHDRIEEFYWVSDHLIVFTASESFKFRDGIYLWDLKDDSIVDMLRSVKMTHSIDKIELSVLDNKGVRGYWISLAGVNLKSKQIYAYIAVKNGYSLDPDAFFSPENFYEYTIEENPKKISGVHVSLDEFVGLKGQKRFQHNPLSEKLSLGTPFTLKKQATSSIQEAWLKLPKTGRLETTLLSWQQFSIKNARTPLFPYGLWYLISLYNESFLLVQAVNRRESEILRTYGVEISRALLNDVMAPGYLRAMGAHCHQVLLKGKSLPYRLFNRMSLK